MKSGAYAAFPLDLRMGSRSIPASIPAGAAIRTTTQARRRCGSVSAPPPSCDRAAAAADRAGAVQRSHRAAAEAAALLTLVQAGGRAGRGTGAVAVVGTPGRDARLGMMGNGNAPHVPSLHEANLHADQFTVDLACLEACFANHLAKFIL